MARLRSGFQRHAPRERRKSFWGVGPNAVNMTRTAAGPQVWTQGTTLASGTQGTITRIHGQFLSFLSATSVANGGYDCAVGFGIVSAEAFAAGVASMPSAATDSDWDGWMFHKFYELRSNNATLADGVNAAAATFRFDIDVKAQRILRSDDVLFGSWDSLGEVGTATAFLQSDTRVLVLLP